MAVAVAVAWLTNVKGLAEEGESVLTGVVLESPIPPICECFPCATA